MRIVFVKSFIVIAAMLGPVGGEATTTGLVLVEATTTGPVLVEAATFGLVLVEATTSGLVLREAAALGPVVVIAVMLGPVGVKTVMLGSVIVEAAVLAMMTWSVGIIDLMDDMNRLNWVKFVSRPVRAVSLLGPRVLEAASTRTSVIVTSLSGGDKSSNDSRFEHRDLKFCILINSIG